MNGTRFDVFLSYAREDRAGADAAADALRKYGWSVFLDTEIPNAERWERYLMQQLDAVPCVLVLWSADARDSRWVNLEAERGRERRTLVHASLDGKDPPPKFADLQANDISEWDGRTGTGEFCRLVRAVAMKVGVRGALGTLPAPEPYEDVTRDHLALTSSSWLRDKEKTTPFPYQIHVRLVGSEAALRRVETVAYYFDPAYARNAPEAVDPDLKAYVHVRSDWRTGFTVYELANGYSVVRAAVKVADQPMIVGLARLVDIMDAGPRLKVLYPVGHPGP